MKLYKVLNNDLTSPYKGFQFELGKKYVCENFDTSDEECSNGFYAVGFNGLVYTMNINGEKHSVFEVEVGGRSKEFNQFKRRYEEITIIRELTEDEIKVGLLACEEKEGYRVYEACYPVHPFEGNPMPLEDAKKLLEEWKKVMASVSASVRDSVLESVGYSVLESVVDSVVDSVWESVRASVLESVGYSVLESVAESVGYSALDSVWNSIGDSVGYSVRVYISSLFPHIKRWKGIDHEEGVNPFQSGIDLWKAGYVPSFDGKIWRLHTKDGIAWEEDV